jgi:type IV secretory pathway VirB2 component (pilin)
MEMFGRMRFRSLIGTLMVVLGYFRATYLVRSIYDDGHYYSDR